MIQQLSQFCCFGTANFVPIKGERPLFKIKIFKLLGFILQASSPLTSSFCETL